MNPKQIAVVLLCSTLAISMVVYPLTQSNQAVALEYEFDENEQGFSTLHPVYTRCAKLVDMPAFADEIQKKCGDVHELTQVAAPCHDAMQAASDRFGCCWETVMDGYATLDPEAHHSWRLWQGTLSGKAGVTFNKDSCGDAMGERGFEGLENQVQSLEHTIQEQSWEIMALQSPYNYGYYKNGQPESKLAQAHLPPRGRTAAKFHHSYHGARRPDIVM